MLKQKQKALHGRRATKPCCQHCGSQNVFGISRVVGYFSRIQNWNPSKQAELRDRRKGRYEIPRIRLRTNENLQRTT